jgi:hypothetical protein
MPAYWQIRNLVKEAQKKKREPVYINRTNGLPVN